VGRISLAMQYAYRSLILFQLLYFNCCTLVRYAVHGDERRSALPSEFAIFAHSTVTTKCGNSECLRTLAMSCDRSSDRIAIELRSASGHVY